MQTCGECSHWRGETLSCGWHGRRVCCWFDRPACDRFSSTEPDGQLVDRLCARALANAKTVPLREATLFRLRRLSRHLCSQAVIDTGDSEYMVAPCWVRDEP